jgi:hypothetical protein
MIGAGQTGSLTDLLVADCIPLGWQRLKDSPGLSRDGPVLSAACPKLLDFRSIGYRVKLRRLSRRREGGRPDSR